MTTTTATAATLCWRSPAGVGRATSALPPAAWRPDVFSSCPARRSCSPLRRAGPVHCASTASPGAPLQAPSWAEHTAAARRRRPNRRRQRGGWCETPSTAGTPSAAGARGAARQARCCRACTCRRRRKRCRRRRRRKRRRRRRPTSLATRRATLTCSTASAAARSPAATTRSSPITSSSTAAPRAASSPAPDSPPPCPAKPPPPPPPPPVYREIPDTTSKESRSVIDGLNARFAAAHPSSDLNVAGVIMRAFDGLSNPGREWEPCVKYKSPNRFPTSLAFPGHTDIYSNGPGGWIIRPIGVHPARAHADCARRGGARRQVGCAGRRATRAMASSSLGAMEGARDSGR